MTDSLILNLMVGHIALGTALVLILLLLRRIFTDASAAHWHSAWAVTLLVLLAMPLLALVPRAVPEATSPAPTSVQSVERPSAPANLQLGLDVSSSPVPRSPSRSIPKVGLYLVLLWFLLAAYQLFLLLRALRYVSRMRRSGRYVQPQVTAQANRLARAAGMRVPVTVLWSDTAVAPQTVGTVKPVVLLPARWQPKPDPFTLEHALAHELAHLRRGDHRWVWLQFAARILLGFNPAIWVIINQMNRERENACDDWAMALGASPKACASSLLSVAASLTPGCPPELAIPCLRSKNHLRRRISHMLNQEKNHSTRSFGKLTLVAALVAGAGAAVAAPQWIGTIQQLPTINISGLFSPKRGDESRIPQPQDGLLYAAWEGDLALAQSLLDAGEDPDAVNRARDPRTALLAAARRQHWEVLVLLIDRGANVNNRARGDESVLMAVSRHGGPDLVEMLLSRGAEADARIRGDGAPLIAAARGGNTEAARLLLQAGADPDVWVEGDESPLFHAVVGGHGAFVDLLLEAGADPSVAYAGDGTPLMLAIRHGHDDIARKLMAAGAKVGTRVRGDGTALIDAARRNSLITAEALLASGADVNDAVRGDGNALINAARGGHVEMSALLLSNGAEVNAHVKGDDTPLINAVWSNNPDLVQLLLDHGADPNLEGDYDRRLDAIRTPMNQAAPDSEIASRLANAGARQPSQ